jgi:hypothetical protein
MVLTAISLQIYSTHFVKKGPAHAMSEASFYYPVKGLLIILIFFFRGFFITQNYPYRDDTDDYCDPEPKDRTSGSGVIKESTSAFPGCNRTRIKHNNFLLLIS